MSSFGYMWVSLFLFCFSFVLIQDLENFSSWVVGCVEIVDDFCCGLLLLFRKTEAQRGLVIHSRSCQQQVAKPGLKPDLSDHRLLLLTSVIFKLAVLIHYVISSSCKPCILGRGAFTIAFMQFRRLSNMSMVHGQLSDWSW